VVSGGGAHPHALPHSPLKRARLPDSAVPAGVANAPEAINGRSIRVPTELRGTARSAPLILRPSKPDLDALGDKAALELRHASENVADQLVHGRRASGVHPRPAE